MIFGIINALIYLIVGGLFIWAHLKDKRYTYRRWRESDTIRAIGFVLLLLWYGGVGFAYSLYSLFMWP